MVKTPRSPLQVSDTFLQQLKEVQKEIRMNTGENKSLRDLTEELTKNPLFMQIKQNMVRSKLINNDLQLRMDRRR